MLQSSRRVLVVNTSHGVLTDVAQAASLKQEDQGIFIKQIEIVINQGEGVMVGINSETTYRKSSQGNY